MFGEWTEADRSINFEISTVRGNEGRDDPSKDF
jgi:hypothetical protein